MYDDKKIGKEEMAEIVRDNIHNLDLSNPDFELMFTNYTRRFFAKLEGFYLEAYADGVGEKDGANLVRNILASGQAIKGNITVGIGFNMDGGGAKDEWDEAGMSKSFEGVRTGKIKLTEEEVVKLFDHSIKTRIKWIKAEYKGAWEILRPNEKLAILSAYFNGPGTVGIGTNFRKHMIAYAATGDTKYLEEAYKELRYNTNKEGDKQERRNAESTLLDSRKCLFAVAGAKHQFPKEPKVVYAGKTRIPRGMPTSDSSEFSDFFVWRTCLDAKVRPEHWKKEELIYRKSQIAAEDLPGGKHNCRCYAESVPNVMAVIEDKAMNTEKLVYKHISLQDSMMCIQCLEIGWIPLYDYVQKNSV